MSFRFHVIVVTRREETFLTSVVLLVAGACFKGGGQ